MVVVEVALNPLQGDHSLTVVLEVEVALPLLSILRVQEVLAGEVQ